MKIGILSSSSKLYSTARLKAAARARGHTVRILNTANFSLDIKPGKPDLLYKGKAAPKLDAIVPRVVASKSFLANSVVRQFEQMGVFCLNSSYAISVARDKLRTMQILSRHKIGIPDSAFVFGKSDIEPALDRIGGAPAIIKVLEGTQGAGVILAESKGAAAAMIQALQMGGHGVLIQKFVKEAKGRDIRAFVVGDRVVAAMRRIAKEGEFRSNVHLGAQTEAVQLNPEYERVAVLASHIIGLRVAGVDMLESNSGPQVLEVNASPGLEGIEGATHIDVGDAIFEYLEEQIQFPDVDIRQRLSLGKGYSIVEVPVLKKSVLAGKTIAESKLGEREIEILSITRDSITIPLPRSAEVILPGDALVCFGKQLALKAFLPQKKSRSRKQKELSDEQIEQAKA
jgi:ribosomal protein S6--L-glutamate ligase